MSFIRHVWEGKPLSAKLRLRSTSMTVSMFAVYLTGPGQKKLLGSVTLGSHQDQADLILGASEISAALDPTSGPTNFFRFLIDVVHHKAQTEVEDHGWTYAFVQGEGPLAKGVDQDGASLQLKNSFVDWPLVQKPFPANSGGIATETVILDVAERL